MERIVIGISCDGKEIVPVAKRLSMHRNRHTTCDGNSWGWIEGCEKHVCWSDDFRSRLTSKQARELIEKWNNKSAIEAQNTST